MAEHTALIQFPPPRRVYLITKGPGLLSTIIYSELDLEASGLETGNQEQHGNRILFVFLSQPPPPDCLPSRAWRTSLSAVQAVPEGTGCAGLECIPGGLALAGITHQPWPWRYRQAQWWARGHLGECLCVAGQQWDLWGMLTCNLAEHLITTGPHRGKSL